MNLYAADGVAVREVRMNAEGLPPKVRLKTLAVSSRLTGAGGDIVRTDDQYRAALAGASSE